MAVIFLFLLAVSVGSLTTMFWIPENELGRGYFQMNALVALGLLGIALVIGLTHPARPFGSHAALGVTSLALSLAALFVYYGTIWRERWDLCRFPLAAGLAGATVDLLAAGLQLGSPDTRAAGSGALLILALISSALLLGWSLITMLLGHWYLIAPKLEFKYLVIFCQALLALVVARSAAVAASLLWAARGPAAAPPLEALLEFSAHGMFFWVRVLWGILVPLLLGWMSLHCARNESNQSATGILYVLVVGTFIGEITAYYLTLTTRIPV